MRHSLALLALCCALAAAAHALLAPRPPLLDNVPLSTAYTDRHGTPLRLALADDDGYRLPARLEDISPHLIRATLAQEDRHFAWHPGVNPASLLRGAWETYVRRSRPVGGSTITMQVVRLRDGLNTRTLHGKMQQILRALALEAHYTKDQILEAYFTLAPYGGNIYGAEAAARIYFRTPARDLTPAQAQALALIPQNPTARAPLGGGSPAWEAAQRRVAPGAPLLPVYTRVDLPFAAPHFVGSVPPAPGVVRTTLDLPTQAALERVLHTYIQAHAGRGLDNAAAILVHVPTAEVRALIGAADFADPAIAGQVDITRARRSPGSALKPALYALALDQGLIHPATLLADTPTAFAAYRPANYDGRFIGPLPAREALVLSRNVPAIDLAGRVRRPDFYTFLQHAGAALPQPARHYGLTLAVGGAEVDMRTVARVYTMLAAGGVLRELRLTQDSDQAAPKRLLSPEAALLALQMLERPRPDAPPPFAATAARLPVYWKTGTSSGFRDAWAAGVFGPYALVVWVGHADGRRNPALLGPEAAEPLFFALVRVLEARARLEDALHPAMAATRLALVAGDWVLPGISPIAPPRAPALEILSPRPGVTYVWRASGTTGPVPLEARGRGPITWFVDNRCLGAAHGPLFWPPEPGRHVVRAVDASGGGAAQAVTVTIAP